VLVVLDVDVLVVLELVLLEVLELLLDVLELVEVLVVVVMTSVPSCFSERNGWSTAASWSRPSFRLSNGPL
jgi:hypothetical protein